MRSQPGGNRSRSARLWVFVLCLVVALPLSGLAQAAEATVIWKPPVTGRLKPDNGISISQNGFVSMEESDVIMQDKLLVAINGAGIQQLKVDYGTLRKVPTDGYSDEVAIAVPDGVYVIRNAAGQYAKLCLCGTYYMGMSGDVTFTEIGTTLTVQSAVSGGGSTPQPQPTPITPTPITPQPQPTPITPTPITPVPAPGVLTATARDGQVVLSWAAFATPNQGYYVFKGTAPGSYGPPLSDFPAPDLTYTDADVQVGTTYYYTVKAYNDGSYLQTTNEASVQVSAPAVSSRVVKLQVDNATAEVNGSQVTLDVPPQLMSGRTMVPLRFVAEALGSALDWNGNERKITLTTAEHRIVLWVDNKQAQVDGVSTTLDVPPTVINGRTLVPLRFAGENLGATLKWNPSDKSIVLTATGGGDYTPDPAPVDPGPPPVDPGPPPVDPGPPPVDPGPPPVDPGPAPIGGDTASWAGDWRCMSFAGAFCPVGWNMMLNADGTFSWGPGSGTFQVSGNMATFSDTAAFLGPAEMIEPGKFTFYYTSDGFQMYVLYAKAD